MTRKPTNQLGNNGWGLRPAGTNKILNDIFLATFIFLFFRLYIYIYIFLMLSVGIFPILADVNLLLLVLCVVVICNLVVRALERWYVRRQKRVVVVWPMIVLGVRQMLFGRHSQNCEFVNYIYLVKGGFSGICIIFNDLMF